MLMWGNHIQRVQIVINDGIIEQVTDFKYLGYCISEHKSNLEDKLQTYSKINTLKTGLLNCLNARSRGLIFRHRASCI